MTEPLDVAVVESRWWKEGNTSVRGLFDIVATIKKGNPDKYHYEMFNNAPSLKEMIHRVSKKEHIRNLYIAAHGWDDGICGAERKNRNLLIHEAQQGCRDATYEPSRFPVAVPYSSPHRATPAYVVVTSSDLDTSRNKASVSGLSWISRNRNGISRTRLGNMLSNKSLSGLYLSSCFTANQDTVCFLLERSEVRWIAGYSETVDWLEGASVDLYFWARYYASNNAGGADGRIHRVACKMKKRLLPLCKNYGFNIFIRGDAGKAEPLLYAL